MYMNFQEEVEMVLGLRGTFSICFVRPHVTTDIYKQVESFCILQLHSTEYPHPCGPPWPSVWPWTGASAAASPKSAARPPCNRTSCTWTGGAAPWGSSSWWWIPGKFKCTFPGFWAWQNHYPFSSMLSLSYIVNRQLTKHTKGEKIREIMNLELTAIAWKAIIYVID